MRFRKERSASYSPDLDNQRRNGVTDTPLSIRSSGWFDPRSGRSSTVGGHFSSFASQRTLPGGAVGQTSGSPDSPGQRSSAVRFVTLLAGHLDFMLPTRCDHTKTRNLSLMINIKCSLMAPLRWRNFAQAQVNDCSVQAVEFMSELKTMGCLLATAPIQSERQFPEDLVRTFELASASVERLTALSPTAEACEGWIQGGYQIS